MYSGGGNVTAINGQDPIQNKSQHKKLEILNVSEIQRILNIGRRQAYELVNSGQFHVVRVGKRIIVSRDVFLNWLVGCHKGKSD